jgi:23S rRNA (adenine2503-C2)-methyltransferase
MQPYPSLYGLNAEQIYSFLALAKPYQAKQIQRWLLKGVTEFSEMTDLSKAERERLTSIMGRAISSEVVTSESDESGATKLGIRMDDGAIIEAVLLIDERGRETACLSSQVGCAQNCSFCKTATMGLIRNLQAFEIIEQFIHLQKVAKGSITHIVYMGMGEPLANTSEVIASINAFHDPTYFDISLRRITLSTCGIVSGIERLAREKIGVQLAVSLVTADNRLRSTVMEVNKRFNVHELKDALIAYQRANDRRITVEYCLLGGVNTDEANAYKLATWLEGLDALVNLIPWNPVEELPYTTPTEREVNSFGQILDRLGITYSRRRWRGRSIEGACGQLAVPLNTSIP